MVIPCDEVLAAGPEGIAVCILPSGHEGGCDGGGLERLIGEGAAADRLERQMDREDGW